MKVKLAAYPLLTIDPFISVWGYTEKTASADTRMWYGQVKRITAEAVVDGAFFPFMAGWMCGWLSARQLNRPLPPTRPADVWRKI